MPTILKKFILRMSERDVHLCEEGESMNEKRIRLSGTSDVREFVRVAEKCDFDIDISYNRIIVDAKSFLGVLGMDLNQVLTVTYGGSDSRFENVLQRYAVA